MSEDEVNRWNDDSGFQMLGKFLGTEQLKSLEQQRKNRLHDQMIRAARKNPTNQEEKPE